MIAVSGVATLLAALGSLWVAGRLLDRRPFAGFGFRLDRRWWGDLAFGLALGMLLDDRHLPGRTRRRLGDDTWFPAHHTAGAVVRAGVCLSIGVVHLRGHL